MAGSTAVVVVGAAVVVVVVVSVVVVVAAGVTDDDAEAAPDPAELTALSVTPYVTPLVKPVISTGEEVTAGENAVQFEPPSSEYS